MYKGFGRPTVFHALIVIFAEFFAWGLLTTPTITALKKTFPGQTLMINGLIWGIKVRQTKPCLNRNISIYFLNNTLLTSSINLKGNSILLDEPSDRLL